jgi:hypothetical protein
MELLNGRSLRAVLEQDGPLEVDRAIQLLGQVLSALAAAHKHGIVHRDLKPENIFVVETEERPSFVKLLDFGISKVMAGPGENLRGTAVGMIMGTPEYMSPEQATGDVTRIDRRTDLYAAGVVLYELVCGRTPFRGPNYNAVMAAIVKGEYVRPVALRPDLPSGVEEVIVGALRLERDDRWTSAEAMRQALLFSADPVLEFPDKTQAPPQLEPLPPPAAPPAAVQTSAPAEAVDPSKFAPPPDPPALVDLDLAPSAARSSATRRAATPAAVPALPAPERERGTLADDLAPPRLALRRMLPWLLLIPLAAGGVVAARALLPARRDPHAIESVSVGLRVTPREANVRLDGQPVAERAIALALDTSHTLDVSAPGRIGRHKRFTVTAVGEIAVRLPHALALFEADDPPASAAELELAPPEARDAAAVDAARRKLGLVDPCVRSQAPSTCPGQIVEARAASPAMPGLDEALDALLGASVDAGAADSSLRLRVRVELLAARAYWDRAELDEIERDDGRYAGWHMRRVSVAASTLLRALGSPHAPEALKRQRLAELEQARRSLVDHKQHYPDDVRGTPGADRFEAAAADFAALAKKLPRPRSRDLPLLAGSHAKLIEAMNSVVLR